MSAPAGPRADFADRAGAEAFLRALGDGPGEVLPLAEAALALAALAAPAGALSRYRDHLAALAAAVGEAARAARTLPDRFGALNAVLYGRYGYEGDTLTYEDPENANLMSVIDRRKGLPVALGILAIHAGRAQGWAMAGLAMPGHFLVAIEHGGERAILDPFNHGRPRDAAALRELLRAMAGSEATLSPRHYAAVSDRDVLLRLQNNLKQRHLEGGRPAQALTVLERMLMIAPASAPLWHEVGLVQAELGNYRAASAAHERVLALAGDGLERQRSALLLQRLKLRLN
jgi:regulator of sirC expression with transglutaminase-like and TPR domain